MLVLGIDILGKLVLFCPCRNVELKIFSGLSAWPRSHRGNTPTRNGSCCSQACPTAHRNRKKMAHILGDTYTVVFLEALQADDVG